MARPVDCRKGRGSKGVHTEDETVPLGKKDQGRRSPPFDQAGAAESARATAGRSGQARGRPRGPEKRPQEEVVEVRMRRLTPTPVSGDGPEPYDKRGFGPPWQAIQNFRNVLGLTSPRLDREHVGIK